MKYFLTEHTHAGPKRIAEGEGRGFNFSVMDTAENSLKDFDFFIDESPDGFFVRVRTPKGTRVVYSELPPDPFNNEVPKEAADASAH